ncbi:ribonuclease T2-like [Leuresthes tenuis]|uniref:ribonuclease T2-like n=1 Tax=Leuresthes tenuis TaxID=355514 RepID=UPI003B5102C7
MCRSVLPLLVTLSPALLLLPDVAVTHKQLREDYKYGRQDLELPEKESHCTWKCILFTVQWPGGFCQSLNNETLCRIPQSVNNWTIHGLWPLKAQACCSCWPMFHSDVQELEAELNEHWPSLLKTKSSFQFWKEEWRKHGTCAACVEGFNSPLKYFNLCLKLRQQFDIHRLLEDAGITPSCERSYKVVEVQDVLTPHLGDKYEIQCVKDDKDQQVWFQVKVRLFRNLTVGCDHHGPAAGSGPASHSSPGHPCPLDAPFFYLPINHRDPRRPCG